MVVKGSLFSKRIRDAIKLEINDIRFDWENKGEF